MKFLRKSVTVTARYCLLFIVERKYDLRQPEDISGKELSGGILLHTEIPLLFECQVNDIIAMLWSNLQTECDNNAAKEIS